MKSFQVNAPKEKDIDFKNMTQSLFDIIEGYLNKSNVLKYLEYEVQAIRRKYVPIFLFRDTKFHNALEFPQKVNK